MWRLGGISMGKSVQPLFVPLSPVLRARERMQIVILGEYENGRWGTFARAESAKFLLCISFA